MDSYARDYDRGSGGGAWTGAAVSKAGPAHAGARTERKFRPDIQGLRAIAVLSVVLYHANTQWLPGGFAGVDIFFVISGYLITGILLSDMDRGAFSLAGFYERRVRRLFPALFTMLAAVLALGALVLPAPAYEELGRTAFATVFFTSNIVFQHLPGEFHDKPLIHTWSLAVEEQFYLAFPLFLFAVVKLARRWLRPVLIATAAASLAACLWMLGRDPVAAFYLAPCRGYELLIGAAIARLPWPTSAPVWSRHALSLAGLALIAGSLLLRGDVMPFPGLATLAPCLGTACVLFAGSGAPSLGGRLISSRPFSFFGDLSYSLYLWHWPVFVLGASVLLHKPSWWESLGLMGLSVALATLSWRFVEQPFLRQTRLKGGRALIAGLAAMAMAGAVTAVIVKLDGLPQRVGASPHVEASNAGPNS